jgi:maltose-binding protein MalE
LSTAIGDDEKALAWSCPEWGIPWIIGSNDKKAADGGRWGLIKPTFPYFWGATWYGIYSKSPNQDTAWEFIKFFTTNKQMMRVWADETQELPNNMKLLEEGSVENKITGMDVF